MLFKTYFIYLRVKEIRIYTKMYNIKVLKIKILNNYIKFKI
jgi:hypothetical protein